MVVYGKRVIKVTVKFNVCPSLDETLQALKAALLSSIKQSIKAKDQCAIALAGGGTPQPLYRELSHCKLPWYKLTVTLTDERWVSTDHQDSNQNMITQCLLNQAGSELKFIPLKNNYASAIEGEAVCEASLSTQIKQLDVVVLGMGDDGHFASIFPDTDNVSVLLDQSTQQKCMAVSPPGKQARMSLTLSYLLTAKVIYLLITGDKKKQIIDDVMSNRYSSQQYPVSILLNQQVCPVHIYWNA
jgi:6-phosphogluconolactonase